MSYIGKVKSSLITSFKEYDWDKLRWRNLDRMKLYYAFRSMLHPIKVFNEIRFSNKGSVLIASVLFILNFVVQLISYSGVGFIFNMNRPEDFNIFAEFLKSNMIIVLWCITNWATTTLFDGEGKFSHIWIATNYAMLPRIIFTPLVVLLTNFICIDEAMFYTLFDTLIVVWIGFIALCAFITIHQFTLMKTIASSLITVVMMIFILFIALLFISIAQQIFSFVKTIAFEVVLRS
ncbi:MAG: hypothetical protein E7480_02575 [Ruminococcaceae bacterium]|nr:hypothetical protein [Oscillospiraceae bacterium]